MIAVRPRLVLAGLLAILPPALPAAAEIVYFQTGRTMSVRSVRQDGETLHLTLREGGEFSCAVALVARIAPDEVAYPEPAEALTAAVLPVASAAVARDPRPFDEVISRVSAVHGVDPQLVHAIVAVESSYRVRARSSKGAKGLMQLMPATARQYAVRDPYDPGTNLDAGVRHLKDLLSRFDLSLAVAAYNAGEGMVRRYGGIPPFAETRAYVKQVLARLGH